MAFDNNLVLDTARTVTNEAQTTPVNVEGGVLAWLCIKMGTLAANGDALNVLLQYLKDGTNWRICPGGRVQQMLGTDDNKFFRVPVFIPTTDTKGQLTPVRLDYELSENGTESFVVTKAWLEPIDSLAAPAVDKLQNEGVYQAMAKATVALL